MWCAAVAAVCIPSAAGDDAMALLPAESLPPPFFCGPVPRVAEIVDDAALNDVCCVGTFCWAVGERGVVLRSTDAGRHWQAGIVPLDASLQSVCFLTDRTGFVAGFQPGPVPGSTRGVLLATRDGGRHWVSVRPTEPLPGIRSIRFFDRKNGYAVTGSRGQRGGRLLRTDDGGRSWVPVTGDDDNADWAFLTFSGPLRGIVTGYRGSWGLVNDGQMVVQSFPRRTMRSVRAAALSPTGQAWLAGDGAFVLHSTNGGVTWSQPVGQFPRTIRDVFDFRTVVCDGPRVCVAGTPGCCILRSADAGSSWDVIPCPGNGTIRRLLQIGPQTLLAVGSWGLVLRSEDFGQSWRAVRSGSHRAALMYVLTDPHDASAVLLGTVSGDQGYRVVAVQPSARYESANRSDHLQAALAGLGVGELAVDWRLVRFRLLQERSREGLLQEWNRVTDGRAEWLLPARLAVQIRTWRPDVICVESSGPGDRAADLWCTVLSEAGRLASGQHPRSVELDEAGLPRWQVHRIVRRVSDQRTTLSFDPDALLPHLRTTAGLLADAWEQRTAGANGRARRPAYDNVESGGGSLGRSLFEGLSIPPGGPARRSVAPVEESDDLAAVVRRHRNQQSALTAQVFRSPLGTELIADLQRLGDRLPPSLGLAQVRNLLRLYGRSENLNGRIAVLKEILRRSPESPDAAAAAAELHLIYSSLELRLLRQHERYGVPEIRLTAGTMSDESRPEPVRHAVGSSGLSALSVEPWRLPASGTSLGRLKPSRGSAAVALENLWNRQAERAWTVLNQMAPAAAHSAEHLLIRAARYRRAGQTGEEQTTLAAAAAAADHRRILAANEMQATFSAATPALPVFNLPRAARRPKLDGMLSDECWAAAPEIRLQEPHQTSSSAQTLLLVTWDEQFVFLAGRMPAVGGQPPGAEAFDRTHDEADTAQDHIRLILDVDRDYATAWEFVIDSSGRTADRCWELSRWNPEWYVATWRDETEWHFEAAVPVAQISDRPLKAGRLWALSARRIVPGYADQRMAGSGMSGSSDTDYSMLRFIRNRRQK